MKIAPHANTIGFDEMMSRLEKESGILVAPTRQDLPLKFKNSGNSSRCFGCKKEVRHLTDIRRAKRLIIICTHCAAASREVIEKHVKNVYRPTFEREGNA